jgi:hypothetical protein
MVSLEIDTLRQDFLMSPCSELMRTHGSSWLQEASASEVPSIAADALTVSRSILRVLQVIDRFEGNLLVGFTLTNSGSAS